MSETYTVMPLSPIRKVIAARMSEAIQSIPHFRLVTDIDIDPLLGFRMQLRDGNRGADLSLTVLLVKACASALMEVPELNVQWVENALHQYRAADISVVMALEGGLATPIVRRANSKSVWEIARELRGLTRRAMRKELRVDEILGGSFSLSNLGMYGVQQFDAIINPPQCAILAVGAAKPTVVVTPERQQRIATMIRVTLSCDHRAIDGAMGAKFLKVLRTGVEKPSHMLLGDG